MKFYVMSETEFRQALYTCLTRANAMDKFPLEHEVYQHWQTEFEKAEAACRAREVREVDLELLLDLPRPNPKLTKVWKEIPK